MPIISRFLGISVMMFYRDHNPPHFHVKYNKYKAIFSIQDLKMTEGRLPKRIISLILEWANDHRDDLISNWKKAEKEEKLNIIKPLV